MGIILAQHSDFDMFPGAKVSAKLPPAAATTAAETAISIVPVRKKLKFLPLSSFAHSGGPDREGFGPAVMTVTSVLQTLSCARPPSQVGGSSLNQRARQWINRPKLYPSPSHAGIAPQTVSSPASRGGIRPEVSDERR